MHNIIIVSELINYTYIYLGIHVVFTIMYIRSRMCPSDRLIEIYFQPSITM